MPALSPPADRDFTFLFTDIEGSTRLWERHPGPMREALARRDRILRECIEGCGGTVFKTVGDAFCAVFDDPAAAVRAALEAQRRLAAEPWPEEAPVRVRMGLHAGPAIAAGGDYFGPTLNRCARLMGIGHGGQTLLSGAARDGLGDPPPGGAALRDLAAHRLKDLAQPERVYQLDHPELPGDFPPLSSLDAHPHNLPLQLTSFVGRERALAEIRALAAETRILTLVGAGGAGKTRLALQLGAELQEELVEGPWFVDLAPLPPVPAHEAAGPGAAEEVLQAVARALELREEPGRTLDETVTVRLGGGRQVVLLDNCEHLAAAVARVAASLVRRCPALRVVATSRERLGVAGETVWPVPMLALPEADLRGAGALEAALQSEAVALFAARAAEAAPGFALDAGNVGAVAEICRRLDGIALAIELAAARVRVLAPAQIAERVDQRLRLLTGGRRDALPRQQTLRALIDWSHDLLAPDERRLLARVSVFRGGWSLEAAEAVCAGDDVDAWAVLDLLSQLVDKSLVVAGADGQAARFHLLETVREYAAEKLALAGEAEAARGRHLAWALGEAEAGFDGLAGPDQGAWMARLDAEHDNLRAALDRAAEAGRAGEGLRLAGGMWRFWFLHGDFGEGRAQLERFLAFNEGGGDGGTPARALALHGSGALAYGQGDYATARARYEACLDIRSALGDRRGIAALLNNLAVVARDEGDFRAAGRRFEESLAAWREVGDERAVADVTFNRGVVAIDLGELDVAAGHLAEAEALRRRIGHEAGVAACRMHLGFVDQLRGDPARAARSYDEAEASLAAAGQRSELPLVHRLQAASARLMGALERGRAHGERALALARALHDARGEALAHFELGRVALDGDALDEAAAHLGESEAVMRRLGHVKDLDAVYQWLGRLALRRGDPAEAERRLVESLRVRRGMRARAAYPEALEGLCGLGVAAGRDEDAVALAGAADAARAALGLPRPQREADELNAWLATATARLGADRSAAARRKGAAADLDALFDALLAPPAPDGTP